MADAAHLQDLRPEPADAVEKSVDRAQAAQERHAWRRRSELLAALAAKSKPAAPVPCTPVVDQFAERSCAAPAVAEQLALPQRKARPECWLKLLEAWA